MNKFYLILFVIFLGLSIVSQKNIYNNIVRINDPIDIPCCAWLNNSDAKIVDSTSKEFNLIMTNSLEYCNNHLNYKIDSLDIQMSCIKYNSPHPSYFDFSNIAISENLKYQFWISFYIVDKIEYSISFYLDEKYNVKYASTWFFNQESESYIWNLKNWESIYDKIKDFEDGFVLPIENFHVEYNEKYKRFVYIVTQELTNDNLKKETKYSVYYKLNQLLVDAQNGDVLEKRKVNLIVSNNGKEK